MNPEDRAVCAVMAATLGSGRFAHHLSLPITLASLLPVPLLGLAGRSVMGWLVLAAIFVAGLIETYVAARVALDAKLLGALSAGRLDLAGLDKALGRLRLAPQRKLGRSLEPRLAGAARLLKLQIALLAAQLLLVLHFLNCRSAIRLMDAVRDRKAPSMLSHLAARLLASLVTGLARIVTGVRPDWRGCLPEMRQRIYFANHGSHGDFVLIWTVLPRMLRLLTRPVAGADYWDRPGLRGFVGRNVFNALMIDRQPKPAAPHPVELMGKAIAEGSSLILFPEGTRNTTDEPLLPFRSGLYHLGKAKPDIELVPVWIDNISRVMPKGEMLPIPLLCSVVFGAPIMIAAGEAKDAFLERARSVLLALRPGEGPG